MKRGCAKPLHHGHPWVLADSIARIDGARPLAGDEVRVVDERGAILGRGFISPSSAIPVRLVTRLDEPLTPALLSARIDSALRLRHSLGLGSAAENEPVISDLSAARTSAYRVINSEGDGLPGLTVDRYERWLAVQVGTVGMFKRLDFILDALQERFSPAGILDRSDARIRKLESIDPPQATPLRGQAPADIEFAQVHGLWQAFDLRAGHGQKTGLFLDQRENRLRCAEFARGRALLDVCSHGGGFALHASKAGAASLTLIDSGGEALELARRNFERNGIADADLYQAEWTEAFEILRKAGRRFGMIVLDPPKFARTRAHVPQALSAYRELNAQAVRLLDRGGILATCSCSGNVSALDFERAVAAGLSASHRRGTVLERREAGCDHPVLPGFEQGRYLKCLILSVE